MSVILKTIYFLLFFNSYFLYTQNLESIKNQDTIYVYFDKGNNQEKSELLNKDKSTDKVILYTFLKDANNKISFYTDTYLNFDNITTGKKAEIEKIDCKFIKRNKYRILKINFFLKEGFRETYYSIYKKHIYLIELNKNEKKKYTLKEVKINSSYHQE